MSPAPSFHTSGLAVDIRASTGRFVTAMRGVSDAFTRLRQPMMHLHFPPLGPEPRAAKRARKARSRALRMSLKAHRR